MKLTITTTNRFHSFPEGTKLAKGQRERGDRIEDAGNGMVKWYKDGRFMALGPRAILAPETIEETSKNG
jgi:primase-polymerase (primpol)-like protein